MNLGVLGRTQAQARDQVHDEQNQAGATERIGEAAHGIGQLIGQLNVMTVEPASRDHGEAVEMGDVVTNHGERLATRLFPGAARFAYAANKPVRRFPTIPPTACSAKISRVSSTRKTYFSLVAKLQQTAPTTPKMTDDQMGT